LLYYSDYIEQIISADISKEDLDGECDKLSILHSTCSDWI